ncbi:MAG: hypothetical protein P1V20_06975 [Verrucomicrobiales bacterium]|nr:hypothetical protein [Verrucomicrobiales bacterium]
MIDTKLVSVITRSGQRAVIAGEEVGIGVDPVLGADERTIDMSLVLRLLGENKGLLPDDWLSLTILDGEAVAISGKIDSKNHVLIFISPTIVDPAGQRINHPPKPEPTAAQPQQALNADWQALVKKADELALSGSQALAKGEAELAERKYREALKIPPDRPVTEERQKAYLQQWYRSLKIKQ